MRTVLHDRYEIIMQLGKGGSSQVYLCVDNHIRKKWAVKRIERKGLDLSLASHEINNLKELDYYLFPRISDAFSDEKYIYIVTDYIEGKTLEQLIKEKGSLPESLVISYLKELIKGLVFLHSESPPILYLDMKPANIMIRGDGELRLIDFGIAQSIIEESMTMGTPGYAAPEQFVKGSRLSEKTDVFALGMTTFTLLTGQKPYKDYETQISVIRRSCISKRMKELILKSTEYDEKHRITLTEFSSYLTRYMSRDKRFKVMMLSLFMSSLVFCISSGKVADIFKNKGEKEAARRMVELTEQYIEDGEYSREGIRIIQGYVDGKFLDEETEEYFTYEIARNLFEVQRDYSSAKRYFQRLSEDKYPEVRYFIRLCNAMTAFNKEDELIDCIAEFRAYNSSISDEVIKNKNEEMLKLISMTGGTK